MVWIDSHAHLHGLTPAYWRLVQHYGVRKVLVSDIGIGQAGFSYDPNEHQVRRWNQAVLDARREHPGKIEGLCYLNPRHREAAVAEMQRCLRAGMIGVKLWVSVRYDDPLVFELLRAVERARVPVLVHSWKKAVGQLEHESTPDEVAFMGVHFPNIHFVMAHAGGDWEYGVRAIAPVTNVSVDVACSVIDDGFLETAAAWLGADRILWGSDAPASALSIAVGKLLGSDLPEREKRKMAGENAIALYGLQL